jgi:Uma2 family endonuclease
MRWSEVLADKTLQDLPFKIETNEYGQVVMSPANTLHAYFQATLTHYLKQTLGGQVLTECPIDTPKGVKVPDVGWCTDEFLAAHISETPLEAAPTICVEVRSPSNSPKALLEKTELYLAAGAEEVWLVNSEGEVSYYDASGQITKSPRAGLVPNLKPKH